MDGNDKLYSERKVEQLIRGGDLSQEACAVLTAMHSVGAIGQGFAIGQARLSQLSGVSSRVIQECNIELLKHGVVVCSSCGSPSGQYLAETVADAKPFYEQLNSRALNLHVHASLLDQAIRIAADQVASENNGCGTLFNVGSALRSDPG